jgi:hypothetical protein
VILSETITIWHPDAGVGVVHPIIFDQVIELSLRADVRFDPESDQDRAATQYVAMGHVWTAPGWQEESSLCSNGRSSHVFGLFARYS